jgi:superfamily I DNA/RNA helicase
VNIDALNREQRQAVTTVDGPLLVLAGAGTGKTRVIINRIAFLIGRGVAAENILAVTFTNKAAREMRERIQDMLRRETAQALMIGTFHSFCARVLREHIHRLGYSRRFTIANDHYQSGLVRTIMSELGFTGDGYDPRLWLNHISRAKCALQTPEDVAAYADLPQAADVAEVYRRYQQQMKEMDQVDFDDLLVLVLQLWDECPEVLEAHRARYQYLLIDEYQDTNDVQFRLMATLAGSTANICVVGDDDQSIYGWRGANVGNILEFESHFPGARVIRLEQNYRSTATILNAANEVIAHNRERHSKSLWSDFGEGDPILAVRTADEKAEAQFVVDLIQERMSEGRDCRDIAVLFRSNHQSRLLEAEFRKADIPYVLVGSNSFYQRKEILDAISLLSACINPKDDQSLLRILNVPPRGIGSTSVGRLRELKQIALLPMQDIIADDHYLASLPDGAAMAMKALHATFAKHRTALRQPGRLQQKITDLLNDVDYFDGLGRMYKPRADALQRRENVLEFINAVAEFEDGLRHPATLAEFLESFALLDANDKEEHAGKQDDAVTLMTVHAAKGLEFPLVVVVGLERGLFPHLRAIEEHTEEEERRLFYVAMTRAREELVLTYAERRRARGQIARRRPSGFLDELPDAAVRFCTPDDAVAPVSEDVADDYMARMRAMFAPEAEKK